jgi:large subunit ribosomal protein L40
MESACDELAAITMPVKAKAEAGEEGKSQGERYDREIYVKAVKRPDPYLAPKPYGRRISPEQRWKEARIEGLVPRETWVPTETRGKGWNYDWQRPASS